MDSRSAPRDYARLVVGTPAYQLVLAIAAVRAYAKFRVGDFRWEKTDHAGSHLGLPRSGVGTMTASTLERRRPRRSRAPARSWARTAPRPARSASPDRVALTRDRARGIRARHREHPRLPRLPGRRGHVHCARPSPCSAATSRRTRTGTTTRRSAGSSSRSWLDPAAPRGRLGHRHRGDAIRDRVLLHRELRARLPDRATHRRAAAIRRARARPSTRSRRSPSNSVARSTSTRSPRRGSSSPSTSPSPRGVRSGTTSPRGSSSRSRCSPSSPRRSSAPRSSSRCSIAAAGAGLRSRSSGSSHSAPSPSPCTRSWRCSAASSWRARATSHCRTRSPTSSSPVRVGLDLGGGIASGAARRELDRHRRVPHGRRRRCRADLRPHSTHALDPCRHPLLRPTDRRQPGLPARHVHPGRIAVPRTRDRRWQPTSSGAGCCESSTDTRRARGSPRPCWSRS